MRWELHVNPSGNYRAKGGIYRKLCAFIAWPLPHEFTTE
jgi:hypothetical protein